jgi:hypothetical protein
MKAVVFIVVGIVLLLAVNYACMYKSADFYGPSMEMFQNTMNSAGMNSSTMMNAARNSANSPNTQQGMNYKAGVEGFASYFLSEAAGSKDNYSPMGAYDGVTLPTGNNVSSWRYTAPNEKLLGDEFVPGPDSLFMFKNNQCKPECCGASFSCGGGCVCTTPEQRQYIAGRGGNRTAPEDSA